MEEMNMTKRINFITTTLFLALAILFTPITTQAASTGTAKSQAQLEKLLTNKSITTIKITTTKKTTLTIPSGIYNKTLIINASNVHLVNNGKFSDVIIKDLTKYTEKANGNYLSVTDDNKLTVGVTKKASLKSITVSNEDLRLHLVAGGNVGKLTINSAKIVGIHGEHKKPINVVSNDSSTKLNISSLITFTVNETISAVDDTTNSNNTPNSTSETVKLDTENKETVDLSEVKQQAYNKAYSDWLNYFIAQSQTVNKNTSTNTSTNTQQPNNEPVTPTTPSAITPTDPDNELPTENTDETVEEPTIEEPVIEPEEPVATYQMTFTHWDNPSTFTSYTGRSQYAYISNTEDSITSLEGTDWQVAVVSNNEDSTDESLVWTDLSESTSISGVSDSTYYQNTYKLTFNESGKYYLRAKCADRYVYSVPITINADSATYLETEIDGVTYLTQAQVSKNNATFKFTGLTPEEIEGLASAEYIKYKNSSVLHRGLYVTRVRTDLSAHTIYYRFNKSDEYNSSGALFQTATYTDDYKLLQNDSYSNGILTKSRINTYDELGRTYSVITINYDTEGNITSKSGYYYTYDEDGNSTKHNGIPTE